MSEKVAWTFPAGRLVLNKTDVVLVNNVTKDEIITVPTGKRWIVLYGKMHNADDVDRSCYVMYRDSADVEILRLLAVTLIAATDSRTFPGGIGNYTPQLTFPVIADAGMDFQFHWDAGGASAGGTATIFLVVLEIDI